MRRRGKYLRYYIKPVQDGRNTLARQVDFYGLLLAVLIVTYGLLLSYTGSHIRALFLALPLLAAETLLAFRLRRMLKDSAALHNRFWRVGRQCQERIKSTGSLKDLEKLVVEILGKLAGFTDVHTVKERSEAGGPADSGIAARALYGGLPVAVSCVMPEGGGDNAVPAETVIKFADEIKNLGIKRGIMVAAATFSSEARRAALEGKNKVTLVDLYRLVELARLTGHPVFPAPAGEAESGRAASSFKYKKLIRYALGKEKTRGYLLSAGLIFVLYFKARAEGAFGSYYLALGMLNLALSIYCLVSNREGDLLSPRKLP
jgi:hypothetical protein